MSTNLTLYKSTVTERRIFVGGLNVFTTKRMIKRLSDLLNKKRYFNICSVPVIFENTSLRNISEKLICNTFIISQKIISPLELHPGFLLGINYCKRASRGRVD